MNLKFIILTLLLLIDSLCLSAQNVPVEVEFESLLSQSQISFAKGDFDKAISSLNRCLKLNSNSSVANFLLSRIYASLNDFNAALFHANKAYNINPKNKFYAEFLGQLYVTVGDINNSLKFFETFFLTDPSYNNFISFYNVCSDLHATNKKIEILNKLIELYGYHSDLGIKLALDYWEAKDIKKADVEFKRLFRLDSTNLNNLNLMKSFYLSTGKQTEFQQVQKTIESLMGSDISGQVVDNNLYLNLGKMDLFYRNLVESFRNDMSVSVMDKVGFLQNFEDTHKNFNQDSISLAYHVLCETYPKDKLPFLTYSSFLLRSGKEQESLEILKQFLNHDKSDFNFYSKLFRICILFEFYDDLLQYSEEAIELYPDVAETYLFHAVANIYSNDFDTAADDLQISKDLGIELSDYPNFVFYSGVLNYFTGNQNLAFEYFDKFSNLNVPFPFFHFQLAYFYIDSGKNMSRAQSIINHYSNFSQLPYYFYFVRAYYNLKENNISKSREDIMEALKLDSTKYCVYNLAGDISAASGDCTNAIIYWNQSIDRGGNSSLINNKIKNCK